MNMAKIYFLKQVTYLKILLMNCHQTKKCGLKRDINPSFANNDDVENGSDDGNERKNVVKIPEHEICI